MKNSLKKAILRTMLFYDMFDFPLTNQEIFDNLLFLRAEPEEVMSAINNLHDQNIIQQKNGFYYLSGRTQLPAIRKSRYIASYHKWQIIRQYKWIFTWAPFVKMVGAANTLAYGNPKPDGDIDLLVVVKRKRMFTARLILTGLALMTDMWRFGDRVKNRFCLSFFLSEDNLDLQSIKLDHDDIYLAFWTKWLQPIYCDDIKPAERYWRKNRWINSYFPNSHFFNPVRQLDQKSLIKKITEWLLGGRQGDLVEKILSGMQTGKIKRNTPQEDRDGILASQNILKFHPYGVRDRYYRQWLTRCQILDSLDI